MLRKKVPFLKLYSSVTSDDEVPACEFFQTRLSYYKRNLWNPCPGLSGSTWLQTQFVKQFTS